MIRMAPGPKFGLKKQTLRQKSAIGIVTHHSTCDPTTEIGTYKIDLFESETIQMWYKRIGTLPGQPPDPD